MLPSTHIEWWLQPLLLLLAGVVVGVAQVMDKNLVASRSIECYECSTEGNGGSACLDPFNYTTHGVNVPMVLCQEYCTKWVRDNYPLGINIRRTCSSNLEIKMRVYSVCYHESTNPLGQLCFCERSKCNGASTSRDQNYVLTRICILVFLSYLFHY